MSALWHYSANKRDGGAAVALHAQRHVSLRLRWHGMPAREAVPFRVPRVRVLERSGTRNIAIDDT